VSARERFREASRNFCAEEAPQQRLCPPGWGWGGEEGKRCRGAGHAISPLSGAVSISYAADSCKS